MRELKLGDILGGRYSLISKLGGGGFGKTYIAQDMQRPKHPKCVVKQLKPENSHPQLLETAVRLFDSEAEALELLGSHSQIPQLLAHFQEEEEFFVVQELISGESLTSELNPGQYWSESQLVDTLRDILEVLEFIHNNNVIHRDIKPDNIIRRVSDKRLVLVDFGSVKQISGPLTYTSSGQITPTVAVGTQGYMPMEQMRGNPHPSSDVYALGIIGIQAATGLILDQLKEDRDTGELIWKPWARISDSLVEILEKMAKNHFRERYQSAREVLEDLVNLDSESPQNTASVSSDSPFVNAPNINHNVDNIASEVDHLPQPDNPLPSPTPSPSPTLITPLPNSDVRDKTTLSPRSIPSANNLSAEFGEHQTESTSSESSSFDLDHNLIKIFKLSGVLGSGSWVLVVLLGSLLSTVWMISGAWLIIAAIMIFIVLGREKQLPDKILWLTISTICNVLAVLIIPESLSLSSLTSSGVLGVLAFFLIAIFSLVLAFIILSLSDFLTDQ